MELGTIANLGQVLLLGVPASHLGAPGSSSGAADGHSWEEL